MDSRVDDLLRRAAAAHRTAVERELAPLKLTPPQFAVLQIVADAPGVSSADVARIERLTPPTMSVIVGNLERKGALVRRAHAKNARVQCLEPTEIGLQLMRNGRAQVQAQKERIVAAMPAEAAAAIDLWLRRVAAIAV
jgi:DNA-binding MarR family transcriptional regulator